MALRPCRLTDVHLPDQSLIVLNSRVFNTQQSECLAELCPHWGSALGGAYRPIMTGARLNARCWRVDRNVPEEVRSPLLGTGPSIVVTRR